MYSIQCHWTFVSEEMVYSCYFTQILPEYNVVVSSLSAKPEGSKTLREIRAKLRRRQEFHSLSHNPF